ncbi:MAG: serine/threonine protein kinase [Verrucomicrobia bacterium]|nr:serine/threonine protein kinase [Verrucomicrobiota bacterium]
MPAGHAATTIPCATCGAPMGDDAVCRQCLLDLAWFDAANEDAGVGQEGEDSGRVVGGWTLGEVLGRGATAVVYRARRGEQEVALKMLRPGLLRDAALRRRFDQEMRLTATLRHPHILPVLDVGEQDGMPYFALTLAAGGTLATRLAEEGPLAPARVFEIGVAICEAVEHAHSQGVLHRDLKPGNILLDDQGNPYVSDFGVARLLDPDGAGGATWTRIGTPAYMAPEQIHGQRATPATDVFGLGAVLFEMLTGQPPAPAERVLRPLPPAWEPIIRRALSEAPADRHPSAAALLAALASLRLGIGDSR